MSKLVCILTIAIYFIIVGSSVTIPTIDLGILFDAGHPEHAEQVDLLDHALVNFGVFAAINHGIQASTIDSNIIRAKELFSLPKESKNAVDIKQGLRGYLSFGAESGLQSVFEPKEGFSYGYPGNTYLDDSFSESRRRLQQQNVWPNDLSEESKQSLSEYYNENIKVADGVLRVLHGMNMIHSTIAAGGNEISLMRIFHYLPYDASDTGHECLGSSPHTDWGLLTLITQDDVGGLEFFYDGVWQAVPLIPGAVIVNGGDFLRLISNGRYQSPIHRVSCPKSRDRISFVLFYYPGYDSEIDRNVNIHNANDKSNSLSFEFNTLMNGESKQTRPTEVFGEYISNKWSEVLRKKNY